MGRPDPYLPELENRLLEPSSNVVRYPLNEPSGLGVPGIQRWRWVSLAVENFRIGDRPLIRIHFPDPAKRHHAGTLAFRLLPNNLIQRAKREPFPVLHTLRAVLVLPRLFLALLPKWVYLFRLFHPLSALTETRSTKNHERMGTILPSKLLAW